jgi:hypothetical protein
MTWWDERCRLPLCRLIASLYFQLYLNFQYVGTEIFVFIKDISARDCGHPKDTTNDLTMTQTTNLRRGKSLIM